MRSPPVAYAQESLRLINEHRARAEAIEARENGQADYEKERRRYEAAAAELKRREEAELRADAPRWRWLEFGLASLALALGLLFCRGGYKDWASARTPSAGQLPVG